MRYHNAFAAAVPLVLVVAASALGADPQGPQFGANRYAASIVKVCAVPDTDDYVGALIAGEKLSFTVVAAKGSALLPLVTLVAPDGTEITPAQLAVKMGGKSVTLRNYRVSATGRWAVHIAGADGTEGAYTIAFAIGAAPPVVAKNVEVNGGSDCVIPFEGIDGARVDLSVTWKTKKSSVTLASILDPKHVAMAGVAPVVRGNSISVKGLVLSGGNGGYELHLTRGGGAPVCNITVRVTPQGRPAGTKIVKLTDSEPYLDLLNSPVRGVAGIDVRLTGGNFSPADPPTVLFGTKPATAYVMADGKTLNVTPPGAADGSTVSVAVIGSDGQSCVRDGYFHYVPMPFVEDLVDDYSAPVRVMRASGGTTLYVRGSGFEMGQTVLFGTVPATSTTVTSATRIQIVTPAVAGHVRVLVHDDFGRTAASNFEFDCMTPTEVTSVAATGGAFLDASHVGAGGGATVTASGANFLASDRVALGGVECTVTAATGDTLTFTTGPVGSGLADMVVTDAAGQSTLVQKALHVVGWTDATAIRSPGKSAVDALTASRGAVGDLDGDGLADDLVLVSDSASPGTRNEFTRLFLGSSGALEDVTGAKLPGAKTDPAGVDEWRASAVALGDLDGNGALDILIGGSPVASGGADAFEARIFANDGAAAFHLDGASPQVRSAPWIVTDYYTSESFTLFTPLGTNGSHVTALAVGDLDGDGDDEIILGTDHFRTGTLHVPLADVWFDGDNATSYDVSAQWSATGTTIDAPALRIFDNRRGSGDGFVDSTFTRLPRGEDTPGRLPAYHVRDLVLGDVNGDGSLDIVLTWDDPTSVTPYGLANPGLDQAQIATRVLINDGAGFFTDETSSWMPAATGNEFWQADRLVLADLDDDGDLDMVLVHEESIDAYTGAATHSMSALRVLRNDGSAFVDVTATAMPSVPLAGTTGDNLCGTALAVFDFDGDGVLDIAVGTTASIDGGTARSMRLLRGHKGLTFTNANGFLPSAATDSGEANDILLGDLAGSGAPSILLVTPAQPVHSAGGENLRVLDWAK